MGEEEKNRKTEGRTKERNVDRALNPATFGHLLRPAWIMKHSVSLNPHPQGLETFLNNQVSYIETPCPKSIPKYIAKER